MLQFQANLWLNLILEILNRRNLSHDILSQPIHPHNLLRCQTASFLSHDNSILGGNRSLKRLERATADRALQETNQTFCVLWQILRTYHIEHISRHAPPEVDCLLSLQILRVERTTADQADNALDVEFPKLREGKVYTVAVSDYVYKNYNDLNYTDGKITEEDVTGILLEELEEDSPLRIDNTPRQRVRRK